MAGTTSDDTLDDVFQQRSRLRTSTSRSLSIMANGFADSIVNVERYPSAAAATAATQSTKAKNPPLAAADSITTRDSDGDEEGDDEEEEEEEEEIEMVPCFEIKLVLMRINLLMLMLLFAAGRFVVPNTRIFV